MRLISVRIVVEHTGSDSSTNISVTGDLMHLRRQLKLLDDGTVGK